MRFGIARSLANRQRVNIVARVVEHRGRGFVSCAAPPRVAGRHEKESGSPLKATILRVRGAASANSVNSHSWVEGRRPTAI
jgi:hypothetical protein